MTAAPQAHDGISAANPYVGPRPFGPEDKHRFYGREREIADLYSLVVAHRTVLVHAQSGAGKTSLFNAGLVPLLVDSGFDVILPPARVSGHIDDAAVGRPNDKINIYALNAVRTWAPKSTSDEEISRLSKPIPDYLSSLPRRYKPGRESIPRPNHHPDDEPLPRVVIFDQFEELFTAYPEHWADRSGFFEQVNDAMEADPALRVIFGMREDFVAQIDPYEDLLPEEFRTRYRLEKLREIDALDAVKKPLEGTGVSFKSGVAETLVTDLLKTTSSSAEGPAHHEVPQPPGGTPAVAESRGEYVEPVQLQVVCFNLFKNLPEDTSEITKEHLKEFGDVDKALAGSCSSPCSAAGVSSLVFPES